MPLQIINDYSKISLRELQHKTTAGYSVVKSPHVGNQHPSNLVCAKLGLQLNVVSFTSGDLDKNFHPHLRIAGGTSTQIADPSVWTPFARLQCGASLETFHMQALQECFPVQAIETDMQLMRNNSELAEQALRAATQAIGRLWYRRVDADGQLQRYKGDPVSSFETIATDVYRFSDTVKGWIVPNRAHILFELVLQSLSSGRDEVYHLSGPQMVGYIGGAQRSLSKAYDQLRTVRGDLPEVLTVYIVPVSSARFVSTTAAAGVVSDVDEVFFQYEQMPNEQKRHTNSMFAELAQSHPEIIRPIESAVCLSQYDISSGDDLILSEWMMDRPLARVSAMHKRLCKLAQ